IDGSPKANAAPVDLPHSLPAAADHRELIEHPVTAGDTISGMRFALHDLITLKQRDRELRAADVDGEDAHAGQSLSAARTSSGVAVPVPFFVMVMDATRFPKRAAS